MTFVISKLQGQEKESLTDEEKKERANIRETVLHWIHDSYNGLSFSITPYIPSLLPYLFVMQRDSDEVINFKDLYQ